jgi:hypothetical protein
MKRLIALVAVAIFVTSLHAQMLLSPGQSYTYEFSSLLDFGDGYSGPARGFATFYTDSLRSTPGATYTVDLFEANASESPIASVNGTGNVTASSIGAWQDLQGVARVTVTSGDVFFDSVVVNVYEPTGVGDFRLRSSDFVPVPEPGALALGALALIGLLGWNLRKQRR